MNTATTTTNTAAEPVVHAKAPATEQVSVVKQVAPSKPAVKAASKPAKVTVAAKPVPKSVAKPLAKPVAKAAPKVVAKPDAKPVKVKKQKMVRDSFTMPKGEFAVIEDLKARAAALKVPTKKTELIRAGIKALAAMTDAAFLNAVRAVPNLKTGRPAKGQ
jgi:hypothetical protein